VFFPETAYRGLGYTGTEALADAAAVAFCVLAYPGAAGLASRTREVLESKIGTSHAAVIRYAIVLLGGLATILIAPQLFGIAVNQLLLGGAFATILVGIAAQQSLSNVFVGMVLLLARPVDVGDPVLIKSGAMGGELCGQVTEIGITYVRLDTPDGPLRLPNSQVLAAAIAPVRDTAATSHSETGSPASSPNTLADVSRAPPEPG
jgi:small-conductance mechanosensitive channel